MKAPLFEGVTGIDIYWIALPIHLKLTCYKLFVGLNIQLNDGIGENEADKHNAGVSEV